MTRITRIGSVVLGKAPTKLIVSLTEKTIPELARKAKRLTKSSADILEWRVDALEDSTPQQLIKALDSLRKATVKPILATFRTKREGGLSSATAARYAAIVRALIDMDVDAIDIEFRSAHFASLLEYAKRRRVPTIASLHDFRKTPDCEAMSAVLQAMEKANADILKLAVMPKRPEDTLRLLETSLSAKRLLQRPLITIAMGELGIVSRLAGTAFGSSATFAAFETTSAPGQIELETTRRIVCRA